MNTNINFLKFKLRKGFTLIGVIIYAFISAAIIIPAIFFILNLTQTILWEFYLQNTLSYVENFINNRESQIVYIKNKNTTFWKVYSTEEIYWKQYWDNITEDDIKWFDFFNILKNKYKIFNNTKNIKISYLNVSKDYIWQWNINNIRNIFMSWKYRSKWFICKWLEILNKNNTIVNTDMKCRFWVEIYVEKKIKDNVYFVSFIYNLSNYTKKFYIITSAINDVNNF